MPNSPTRSLALPQTVSSWVTSRTERHPVRSGGYKSETKASAGLVPSEGRAGQSVPCPALLLGPSPVIFGPPWLLPYCLISALIFVRRPPWVRI